MNDFLDDLEQLHSRTRQVDFNGIHFVLECKDPYGFWDIRLKDKPKTPEGLKGNFTNYAAAVNKCKWWAESQPQVPAANYTSVSDQVYAPPIRRKRVTDKTK
jgi:hypothetical protein